MIWRRSAKKMSEGTVVTLDITLPYKQCAADCSILKYYTTIFFGGGYLFYLFILRTAVLRLIVRSGFDVQTFATRRLHASHHARAPSGGR